MANTTTTKSSVDGITVVIKAKAGATAEQVAEVMARVAAKFENGDHEPKAERKAKAGGAVVDETDG